MKKTSKTKIFVLDTNILISSAGDVLFGFDDNDVVVTTTTLEELDDIKDAKRGGSERAYGAREAIKAINRINKNARAKGILPNEPAPLSNGGTFRTEENGQDQNLLPAGYRLDKPDNRILSSVKYIEREENKKGEYGKQVILVTNDVSLQNKADSAGVTVQGYRNSELETDEVYTGRDEIDVSDSVINALFKDKQVKYTKKNFKKEFVENEYLLIRGASGSTALAYYRDGNIYKIDEKLLTVKNITPKNAGQRFAMHALLDPNIPMVILSGVAGSGKTLLSVAAGLEGAFNERDYNKQMFNSILYSRTNVLFDEDIGALPGDEEAKMGPLVRPLTDNLECIFRANGDSPRDIQTNIEEYMYQGIVKVESMAFMRGRSISNTFIIIDECQNATPKQIRGICTRLSFGSKVILLGDPSQVDNNYLSARNNGLVFASQLMKGSSLCAQVAFSGENGECLRSPISAECEKRLIVEKQ